MSPYTVLPTCNPADDLYARFHDIAWAQESDDHSQGVIAGALENGSLDLWDVGNLLSGEGYISHLCAEKCTAYRIQGSFNVPYLQPCWRNQSSTVQSLSHGTVGNFRC